MANLKRFNFTSTAVSNLSLQTNCSIAQLIASLTRCNKDRFYREIACLIDSSDGISAVHRTTVELARSEIV